MRFRFRDFVFDTQRQELGRTGVAIPLEPKAFQVLNYLLTHRDQAVSKEELLEACWPGDFVTDSAIARVFKVIRQAVDDDGAQQHTIKTLRSYGYRFIAAVEVELPASSPAQALATPPLIDQLNAETSPALWHRPATENAREHRYALLIGNGHYPLDATLSPLITPERDVMGLADVLTQSRGTRFQRVQQLQNESHHEALHAFLHLLHAVQKDDLVLVYVSGHARSNDQGRLYLAFTNTDSSRLDGTSLSFEQLKTAIDTCPSTRIILLLDCCFSSITGAPIDPSILEDQMRWLASGRKKYVLHASPSPQDVQDRQTETHSQLTRYVIEGLRTGHADLDRAGYITVDQLYQYVLSKLLEASKPVPMKWDLGGKGGLIVADSRQRLSMGLRPVSTAVKVHHDAITQLFTKGEVIPCLGPDIATPFADLSPPTGMSIIRCISMASPIRCRLRWCPLPFTCPMAWYLYPPVASAWGIRICGMSKGWRMSAHRMMWRWQAFIWMPTR